MGSTQEERVKVARAGMRRQQGWSFMKWRFWGRVGLFHADDRPRKDWALDPPHEEQNDENNDKEAGTAADVMIAGAEAVAAATNEQHDEKDEKKIHGWTGG